MQHEFFRFSVPMSVLSFDGCGGNGIMDVFTPSGSAFSCKSHTFSNVWFSSERLALANLSTSNICRRQIFVAIARLHRLRAAIDCERPQPQCSDRDRAMSISFDVDVRVVNECLIWQRRLSSNKQRERRLNRNPSVRRRSNKQAM